MDQVKVSVLCERFDRLVDLLHSLLKHETSTITILFGLLNQACMSMNMTIDEKTLYLGRYRHDYENACQRTQVASCTIP